MLQDQCLDIQRKHDFWEQLRSVFNHYQSEIIPVLMGDFNTRLYHNQISGLESYIGPSTFSSSIEDDLMPSTGLSFMIGFLQDNELSIVSPTRPRSPFQMITYPWNFGIPPSLHCPNQGLICYIGSYPLSHRTSKGLSFPMRSHPLGSHYRHFLPSPRTSSYHIFSLPNLTHLRRGGTSLPQTPSSNTTNLALSAFGISTLPINESPPFLIYADGSCPDQFHISPQNPAGWGVYFESIFLDLYGPVGSLPF